MRRISCVLAVVAVASVAGGWRGGGREGSSSSLAGGDLVATPVAWPALRRLGIAQIETDGRRTWVRTLVPSSGGGGNLFSLDASTLLPRELRVGVRLEEIFAGEGQLWGLPDDGRKVLFIKRSTGAVRARALRRACGELAYPSGVVRLGELWLSCSRTIAVYKPAGGAGRILGSPRSYHLLASTVGVWAVVPRGLVGIAGRASGRTIVVRDATDLQAQGHEAWALDRSSLNRRLIQIDLVMGVVRRVALATQGQGIDHFAVGPNDIWVALTDKPFILRFARSAPKRATAQIDLAQAVNSRDFQIFLSAGPSYAWAEVFSNRHSKLFRVTAPN